MINRERVNNSRRKWSFSLASGGLFSRYRRFTRLRSTSFPRHAASWEEITPRDRNGKILRKTRENRSRCAAWEDTEEKVIADKPKTRRWRRKIMEPSHSASRRPSLNAAFKNSPATWTAIFVIAAAVVDWKRYFSLTFSANMIFPLEVG